MKLEGSIRTFPLRELIDMVVYSSVTGVLNLFDQGPPGHLYFRDSVLYHVDRGASRGEEALAELFELSNATFAFVSDLTVEEESLSDALGQHLQNAERMAARWRQLRPYIPHLDLIPRLKVTREAAIPRVGIAHHQVLAAIDGRASLQQITTDLGWTAIETAEVIVQMVADGLIELGSQPTVAPTAANPFGGNGVFGRVLAQTQLPPRPSAVPQAQARPQAPTPPSAEARTPEELILQLLRG